MSLTIKAYLERSGEEPEIRRFAVDTGVSSNYSYLSSRIPQVFGSLSGKPFEVFWKDNENDLVAFSCDEELVDALGFVNDGIFRIHIREKKFTPERSNEGERHPGVVCDSCNSDICGSRFKCMECPDYDLCSSCENKGEHTDHRMIRLASPNVTPFASWDGQFGPSMAGMFGGGHSPHHGPPPPMGPFGGMGGPGMGPPGFGGPGCGGPGGFGGRQGWPLRKMMKRCWKQWMKNMWQQNPEMFNQQAPCSEEDVKQCKEPRTDNGEKSEKEQCGGDEEKCAEGGSEEGDEYLRNVGDSVAAMLDPLGISVDVEVDQQGKRKRCHGGNGGRGRFGGRGGWRRDGGSPWANPWASMFGMGRGGNPWAQWGNSQEQQRHANQTSQDETQAQDDSGKVPDASAPSPADIHMNSPPHQSDGDGEWMLLNKDRNEMDAKPTSPAGGVTENPPSEPQQPVYPSLPPLHPDQKINDSLKQLLAMGFTNDGGWLTSLLESKNGDINKVLDALKPHRAQRA